MTAQELIRVMNNTFGLHDWPETYQVDAETYGNVCQFIINNKRDKGDIYRLGSSELGQYIELRIQVGTKVGGLLFKNVELVLKA